MLRNKVEAVRQLWINSMTETMSQKQQDNTRAHETQCHHVFEECDKVLAAVHDLETKLGVTDRWHPSSAKWKVTAEMVARRMYQQCLDQLEALIVSRMFKLTKMNQSQTGMCNVWVCRLVSDYF
jgi:hypothetical protein